MASVRKALVSPLHHKSTIELSDGSQLEAVGNILDKEFEILAGGQPVARISRAWFTLRDTYGVDVAPGQDDVLLGPSWLRGILRPGGGHDQAAARLRPGGPRRCRERHCREGPCRATGLSGRPGPGCV